MQLDLPHASNPDLVLSRVPATRHGLASTGTDRSRPRRRRPCCATIQEGGGKEERKREQRWHHVESTLVRGRLYRSERKRRRSQAAMADTQRRRRRRTQRTGRRNARPMLELAGGRCWRAHLSAPNFSIMGDRALGEIAVLRDGSINLLEVERHQSERFHQD